MQIPVIAWLKGWIERCTDNEFDAGKLVGVAENGVYRRFRRV